MATSLLLPLLALITCSNAVPQHPATHHLSKRLVYYGSSILGSILALGFVVFWFGFCFWYIRYRRRIGRPSQTVETIFMRRYFPWMAQPQPQVIVPQPTVVVVNAGGQPYPQQGQYQYGPVHGQDVYPQTEAYDSTGPYGRVPTPYHVDESFQGRPASPAPVYMGK